MLTIKGHIPLKGIMVCLPIGLAPFALHGNCMHSATKKVKKNIYSHRSVYKPVL